MNGAGDGPSGGADGRVGGPGDASGQVGAGAVAGQVRVVREVVAESRRLVVGVRLAVSALSAIGDSARHQSRFSARARVLELEVLPAAHHLGASVEALHHDILASRASRSPEVAARAEEIRATLARMLEIVTTVDVPGELGMPLELVSTVQAGILDGLAGLDRLRDMLEPAVGHQQVEPSPVADGMQPTATAQWLVRAATRLLPPRGRDRYAEEFAGELWALAEAHAGPRTQLGHALRQVTAIWALRRALSPTTPRPAAPDAAPGRETADTGPRTTGRTRRRHPLREPLRWWLTRRQARSILREQKQAQAEHEELLFEFFSDHPLPGGRSRHRRRRPNKRNDTG